MAQGKQQPKFERNLPNRFWDNCDTDEGRQTTDDTRRTNFDFMTSAHAAGIAKQGKHS